MNRLNLEPTRSTPAVHFDPGTHLLELKGESYPENAAKFYSPIFDWLDQYLAVVTQAPLVLNVEMIYFNSSSSMILLKMFDRLDQVATAGRPVTINWRFASENDVAKECGEEFQAEVTAVRFNLVPLTKGVA
ncbi:MAG: DUF1987 domain-containing protein [Verrucomicrobiota bacterium]